MVGRAHRRPHPLRNIELSYTLDGETVALHTQLQPLLGHASMSATSVMPSAAQHVGEFEILLTCISTYTDRDPSQLVGDWNSRWDCGSDHSYSGDVVQ
jgi:hypothetical protein